MAEAVVGLLIGKLGAALVNEAASSGASLLCHEASALKGLFGEIHEAKDELESMQAYLKAAERFKDTDETTGLFVDRIRGFAFEIEDVVDEFTYKLEDKHGGFVSKMKKRIKYVNTWRRLAHKLNDIKGRLQGAKQRNQDYAMKQMDRNAGGIAFHANQALNFTRDEDLVGITEHKKQLVQWLADDLEQRCKIFTVWGMPGVGKTTLVAHVYLGLRCTAIESLPETIGRLQNLEVLDAFNAQLLYLPNNIVKLQKLRYLYACNVCQEGDIHPSSGVKVPSGIRHLTALQALQCVEASSEILREVGDLTELRTFSVCNVRSEHSGNLRDAVNKMSHLVHLEITTLGEKEVLHLEGLCLPPTFSRLCLQGQLEKKSIPKVLSSWSRLSSLTMLQMEFCRIDEESFPSLLVLRGLCHLALIKAFDGKKLHFTAGCFPRLQFLSIWHAPQLNQVQIEQGAMSNLAELCFAVCPKLKFLPQGIEHLKNLVELELHDTSEELVERLWRKGEPDECKDDRMNISHIRKVTVRMGTRQWIM